jgi:hypothetical protein
MPDFLPNADRYRPSNGTEGDIFMEAWCSRCQRDANGDCPILAATMALDVDDEAYPSEWIVVDNDPMCTAFVAAGEPLPTPRCTRTADMFGL